MQGHVVPSTLPPSVQIASNNRGRSDGYGGAADHESIDEADDLPEVVSEEEDIAHMDIPLDDEFDF